MKQPRMNRILEAIRLERVDAKVSIHLFPTKEDFDKAVRKDPQHCGFANCAARVCGSTQAHFFKRYVFIDHPDEKGTVKLHRYIVSKGVSDAIINFDKTGRFKPGRAFTLRAPSKSESIQGMRAANKKWRQSDTAKAIKQEKIARTDFLAAERELTQAKTIAQDTDAIPGSAKARDVKKRVIAARRHLTKSRDKFDSAQKRVAKLRKATYGTAKAKPRQHDLSVRSGTGAWFKMIAQA